MTIRHAAEWPALPTVVYPNALLILRQALRRLDLVQREGKRLSPAAQAFAQFVLNEAARLTR